MEENIELFDKYFKQITEEVGKVIIGQQEIIEYLLMGLIAGGNILMEGTPGLGKTLLVKTFSRVLDLPFSRIQFTPDLMPTDIIGNEVIHQTEGKMALTFEKGPLFSCLILADEINRATPKAQSALLEAMAEKCVTVGNITYKLEEPFFVLATQNPIEMEGTYVLPEAQVDRFMFKLSMTLPSYKALIDIAELSLDDKAYKGVKTMVKKSQILEMRSIAESIVIGDEVKEKAVQLMLATHPNETQVEEVKKYVRWGSSPRGLQAMLKGAKVRAAAKGRYHVSLEDLYTLAPIALTHRIKCNFRAMSEQIEEKDIIEAVLKQVK